MCLKVLMSRSRFVKSGLDTGAYQIIRRAAKGGNRYLDTTRPVGWHERHGGYVQVREPSPCMAHTDSDPDLDADARRAQAHLDLALRAGVLAQAQAVREAASRAAPILQELEGHPDPRVALAGIELARVLRALAGQACLGELVLSRDQEGDEPGPTWTARIRSWWRRVR